MAFKYRPQWQGPLSGRSFERQTEDAINGLQSSLERLRADLESITGYGDFARLSYEEVTASQTIQASAQSSMQVLVCSGTLTLTLLAANSSTSWILIKNAGAGVVTLQPAAPQITIDGVSQTVALKPNEYIQIIGRSAGAYLVISDGRWPSAVALAASNAVSSAVAIADQHIASAVAAVNQNISIAVSTAIGNFRYMG